MNKLKLKKLVSVLESRIFTCMRCGSSRGMRSSESETTGICADCWASDDYHPGETVDLKMPSHKKKKPAESLGTTKQPSKKKRRPAEAMGKVAEGLFAGHAAYDLPDDTPKSDKPRPISSIAAEIRLEWKNVNYAAKPYLSAMFGLNSINDNYYEDSAKSIVLYFLANARSWTGPKAKEIKAELKKMAGVK